MPTYPIDEKLRAAIDSLDKTDAIWFYFFFKEIPTDLSRIVSVGFTADEVQRKLSLLRNESVDNLVELARKDNRDDRERSSPALVVLQCSDSSEVFEKAKELTQSQVGCDRALGYKLLMREPGQAFSSEAKEIVLDSFERENEADGLAMLAYAAMHLETDGRSKFLKTLVDHPSAAVREAVASSLGAQDDRQSISTLIKLTRDCCEDVRNWATFSLGALCHRNTAPVRDALFARLEDDHEETKYEAIFGLAVRKDPRVLQVVKEALQCKRVWSLALEAAEELADPSLYPLLQNLKLKWQGEQSDNYLMSTLDSALEACQP